MGKGTGLGLATVFGVVKQCQGHIWVYSEPNQGATFKIYLPCLPETSAALPEFDVSRRLPTGTETILVVEDEVSVRDLAIRTLRGQGYTILEAGNGEEALHVAYEYPEKIDLLFTDVVMPQMGGKVLAKRLKAVRPDIKILFTSGYTDNAIVHYGILDSGIAFVQKPFTLEVLVRRVRQALDAEL